MIEYKMPSLGADMESGFLREWRVNPGDYVKPGDIIADVETQKGIIEIEVFDEGVISELLIKVDEKVPVGTVMALILSPEEKVAAKPSEKTREERELVAVDWQDGQAAIHKEERTGREMGVPSAPHHIRASPLARKIAMEKGIDISKVKGSGPDGAISRDDVEKAVAAQASPETVKEKPLVENLRSAIAAAMAKSKKEIPHYYLGTKADMSHALAWLTEKNKQLSVKNRLIPAALIIKATANALKDFPDLNATWENGLQRKTNVHIGFVVALRGGGIVVPAIHHADKKSVEEIMNVLNDLIPRAKALKLRSSELADSTITLTSLGEGAVETVFGVIYPPQVAIVGFGAISQQPWVENEMIGIRPVMAISLSGDHRATDGNTGSQFLSKIKEYLTKPEQL